MKKYSLFLIFMIFGGAAFSQLSPWIGTFVYNVQLPEDLNNEPGVYILILYNYSPLVTSEQWIGDRKQMLAKEFTYHEKETMTLNNIKLPTLLPAKTYSWLLSKEIVEEMESFPDRYKMQVVSTGKPIQGYELPQIFDLKSENCIQVFDLLSMKKEAQKEVFLLSNFILNVEPKNKLELKTEPIIELPKKEVEPITYDTILKFSVQEDGIPKWFKNLEPNYEPKNQHSRVTEEVYFIGYLYKNELYIKRKEKGPKFMCGMDYYLTDLQGNTSQCRIGVGDKISTGNCKEIIKSKKINISVFIEP